MHKMRKHTKILFHGTNTLFDEFSTDYISGKCSIDQYGSGFYFFDTPAKTMRYGNIIMECAVEVNKILEFNKSRRRFTVSQIKSLLLSCPYLSEKLENVNDIDFYGFDSVLNEAIHLYAGNDYVHGLNCIGNDFFESTDTHILLSKFVEITGFDCIRDKELGIYNILTKKQINVIAHKTLEDYK
jgi:hypothetical protein